MIIYTIQVRKLEESGYSSEQVHNKTGFTIYKV